MQIVKKISTLVLENSLTKDKKAAIAAAEGKPVFVGRILGLATGITQGVTQYGKWTGLDGNFRGINPDGEVFMAPSCFIPGGYESLVVGEMGELTKAGADSFSAEKSVSFAFDVYAVKSKGEKGYQYTLSPAGEFIDPMASAMEKLAPMPSNGSLQLPAPVQETLTLETAVEETQVEVKAKKK